MDAAYIFGSTSRGDSDRDSDVDVLAVVSGKAASKDALELAKRLKLPEISPSWYSPGKLRKMWRNGELFAWHLFYEAEIIFEDRFRLEDLGEPGAYRSGYIDALSFASVLRSIPDSLSKSPGSAVHEFGLFYLCMRNIAMSASWYFCEKPNFSRWSPFELGDFSQTIGIEKSQYQVAISARMASQRGLPLPLVSAEEVVGAVEDVALWVEYIIGRLELEDAR